jgi:hypothetical protein
LVTGKDRFGSLITVDQPADKAFQSQAMRKGLSNPRSIALTRELTRIGQVDGNPLSGNTGPMHRSRRAQYARG